jgi:hypothetical protein
MQSSSLSAVMTMNRAFGNSWIAGRKFPHKYVTIRGSQIVEHSADGSALVIWHNQQTRLVRRHKWFPI